MFIGCHDVETDWNLLKQHRSYKFVMLLSNFNSGRTFATLFAELRYKLIITSATLKVKVKATPLLSDRYLGEAANLAEQHVKAQLKTSSP